MRSKEENKNGTRSHAPLTPDEAETLCAILAAEREARGGIINEGEIKEIVDNFEAKRMQRMGFISEDGFFTKEQAESLVKYCSENKIKEVRSIEYAPNVITITTSNHD